MIIRSAFVLFILLLTSLSAFGQGTSAEQEEARRKKIREMTERMNRLSEQASVHEQRALEFLHQREYAKAEASAQAAMEVLSVAPHAQAAVWLLLAEIYLAQNLYEETYRALKPLYKPSSADVQLTVMYAIACARSEKEQIGCDAIESLWKRGGRLPFPADWQDLPMNHGLTPDSLEATALILWGALSRKEKYPEDTKAQLERACALAPRNGVAYYALAMQIRHMSSWREAVPTYRLAHKSGSEKLRMAIEGHFEQWDVGIGG